jgi:hypothetical protein
VKLCPCGGTPTVSRSLRSGSCVWCPNCHKTLTKGAHAFDFPDDAIIEWVHGIEALPPKCPFCKMPATISLPESDEPSVSCEFADCPLHGKSFTLKRWNLCRPEGWTFEALLKRWAGKPDLKNASRALKRALDFHKRGRWL